MEKKAQRHKLSNRALSASQSDPAAFPETQTTVLAQAAAGQWEEFCRRYVAACWREVAFACRGRNLPLTESDDLFQELIVRLMKSGPSRQAEAADVRGNLPARYLKQRGGGPAKAQFRTVLKRVIENLILEQLRARRRAPRSLAGDGRDVDLWIEESVGKIVDQQWVAASLIEAARQLLQECLASPTRGKRRWFFILYLALVRRQTAGAMAEQLVLDRTNVAGLLTQARQRFVAILQKLTGIASASELKDRVAGQPERLIEALEAVYPEYVAAASAKSARRGAFEIIDRKK